MFFWNKIKELEKRNLLLEDELLKRTTSYNIIGRVLKYSKQDEENLSKNKDSVENIMKYLSYQIALRTDLMRNLTDGISTQEKVGYLNCLHELYLFFDKLNKPESKKEEYSGQDLK